MSKFEHLDEFIEDQSIIQHYGVPGMQWGVRKVEQFKDERRRKKEQKKAMKSLDKKTGKRSKSKSQIRKMSDDDLIESTYRFKLEKDYKESLIEPGSKERQQTIDNILKTLKILTKD